MPQIPGDFSKRKALEFVTRQGFTEEYGGNDSRLFYKRPGDPFNANGDPIEYMTVNRIGGFWNVFHHDAVSKD